MRSAPARALRRIGSLAAYCVWPLDRWLLRQVPPGAPVHPAPIFIVGAPRSGSTVLYQIMANHFDIAYISNLAGYFYHSLGVGIRLHRVLLGDGPFNCFESEYGRTPGLSGPAEVGRFWHRWFPRNRDYVKDGEYPPSHFTDLRRTFIEVTRASGRAFLIKNLNCSQRLEVLRQVLPEALVVFCRRDPVANAASLLNGRAMVNGGKDAWWSVRPREIEALRTLPYWEQVVRQVHAIEQQITADLSAWPARQWTIVRYEVLCEDVRGEVARLRAFLAAGGAEVQDRPGARLPELRCSTPRTREPEDLERIRTAVAELVW